MGEDHSGGGNRNSFSRISVSITCTRKLEYAIYRMFLAEKPWISNLFHGEVFFFLFSIFIIVYSWEQNAYIEIELAELVCSKLGIKYT